MSQQILTELRYRSFESLLDDVRVDMKQFALSGKIEPAQLIKVAQRVSYDLGLRINQTKEAVLEVEHSKARLPVDFYVMNNALLCGEFTVKQALPQGTQVWQYDTVPNYTDWVTSDPCNPTNNTCHQWPYSNKPVCLTKCDTGYQLIQRVNTETRTYKFMFPIRFTNPRFTDCNCPNLFFKCTNEAYIKDGFVFTNFDCGNLYINYEGALEDENGNIMVPDQPFLNDYYEYALKEKIIESVFLDGDTQYLNLYQLVQAKLKSARNNALSITNMPDYREMKQVWENNRRAYYLRYYQPMASWPWEQTYRAYGR